MTQAGDQFVAVFNEVYPNLCRFLASMLSSESAAQDLAQECFLRLHRFGLSRLGSGEARFWLFRVGRNLALNEMEKRQTRMKFVGKLSGIFHASVPTPEEVLAQSESRERVFDLLRDLPEHQRAALLLREQEEMSYGEIAEVLNVPQSKVKSDIFRARTLLRERWNNMNDRPARAAEG